MNYQKRYKSLDFLRGIAVLMVIVEHFFGGYVDKHLCWTGVDLFFVLSGFFVSGILFREYAKKKTMHGGRFFIRRVFKIWPLFYAAFLMQLTYLSLKHSSPSRSQTLAELFFVQNFVPGFMQVTWSLGIEEQFYLLVAVMLPLAAFSSKTNWIVPGCILVMLVSLTLRITNYFSHPTYGPYSHHYPLQFRADSLAAGMVISWYYHFHHDRFKAWVAKNSLLLLLISIVFLIPTFILPYNDPMIFTFGFTTTWLGYSGIVILLIFLPSLKPFWHHLFNKNKLMLVIAWVGFYSYAIYLFHFFIGPGVLSNFERFIWATPPAYARFMIFLAADVFFGYVISLVIEQPVLRWRDRIFPAKEKNKAPEPQNLYQHI